MKPYYRKKGKYADGRDRYVIEYEENGKIKQKSLPKPEEFLVWTGKAKSQREKWTG